jgi:hypothetical protein
MSEFLFTYGTLRPGHTAQEDCFASPDFSQAVIRRDVWVDGKFFSAVFGGGVSGPGSF